MVGKPKLRLAWWGVWAASMLQSKRYVPVDFFLVMTLRRTTSTPLVCGLFLVGHTDTVQLHLTCPDTANAPNV
jgi:hypothetical protein